MWSFVGFAPKGRATKTLTYPDRLPPGERGEGGQSIAHLPKPASRMLAQFAPSIAKILKGALCIVDRRYSFDLNVRDKSLTCRHG